MKKLPVSFFSAALIALSIFACNIAEAAEYVPGEILVKFKDISNNFTIKSLHSHIGSLSKREFKKLKVHHVKIPKGLSVEDAIEHYRQDPNVLYAEPNYIVHAAATPDDTSFGSLWGLHNTGQTVDSTAGTVDADIDAPEAWEHTTGSADVIIAVIDTGVAYSHPDFNDNIWTNTGEISGNGIDDDANGYADDVYGWDFIDNDSDPEDYHSHGTHVAGTIAAQGNNSSGITGVMWNAKIMPVRFLGVAGSGSIADAVEAILYATANGAHIINNSWTSTGFSQALKDAIDAFPGIVVCAAGNVDLDNDGSQPSYPASYTSSNIISVAATDHNDSLASFSNYGATSVDLAAPGYYIYSNIPQLTYGTPVTVYSENFNSVAGSLPLLGWSRGGSNTSWAITAGTGVSSTNSLEDSPGGDYLDNTYSWAGYMTPLTSVKNNRYTLSFQWKGDLENNSDYLYINYSSDGATWTLIDYRTGSTGSSFASYSANFTPVADSLDQFYLGFGLYSDDSINAAGVYIDNVTLTREPISISGYSYTYYSGTSMAAPHVSGVAGLIKAKSLELSLGLTTAQIKDAILKGIDAKSGLSGKVLTGGRLNADKAIEYALSPYAPTGLSAIAASTSQINLSWTDNAASEEGFKVERKTGASGTFSEIASIGPNTTSYSDTGLAASTTYYYRVRVYGTDLGGYAYSDEAGAATQAAPESSDGGGGGGGGCFIATAAYGSMMHPYVRELREFRDRHLLTNAPGLAFIKLYYRYSPPVADTIRENEGLRFISRLMLTPLVMMVVFPHVSLGLFIVMLCISITIMKKRKSPSRQRIADSL